MKIIQICLCGSYNPTMGYQDNILPKYYLKMGLECITIASEYYKDNGKIVRSRIRKAKLENGSSLIRIPNRFNFPYKLNKTLRMYSDLYKILEEEKPDIIFLHNFQFLSFGAVKKYCEKNTNVVVYADSHTDYINSARNWISLNILHKLIWRYCTKRLEPYVKKFWGVTEQRCRFLEEVYHVPKEKIDLLVMGADDEKIQFDKKDQIRQSIREALSIKNDDFVVITGGKIDRNKNIHLLIDAFNNLNNDKFKLIVFGTINNDMERIIYPKIVKSNIKYIGWLDADKVYDYFLAADLGVFPGTHSVLWEQAVGTGLPCIFKRWNGMQHVDVGGNCIFLNDINENTIMEQILSLYDNKSKYKKMKKVAENEGIKKFSYYEIARGSIEYS